MTTAERESGLRIVSLGGGTGLSSVLAGLKAYVGQKLGAAGEDSVWIETLTAVVTVTDDGGSSGRLRDEFQMLPPGDIRNCMVALAEDEHLLTRLFQYRFESEGDLSGHSFGNLFLAALADVTGDFLEAIRVSGEVLKIRGKILPSTVEDVSLVAELEGGGKLEGETRIAESRSRIERLRLSRERCRPLPETLEAISHADLITIGPGSLYTSIIPNLLVEDIVAAIAESSAVKVYVCNIMTQPGETQGFSLEDHLRALCEHSHGLALDWVLVNSASISEELRARYLADGSVQVELDESVSRRAPGIAGASGTSKIVVRDLLNESGFVRHDPRKLARALLEIYCSARASSAQQAVLR
ncbi:MAG: YvcK family protein [Blastocatellia bacterium]